MKKSTVRTIKAIDVKKEPNGSVVCLTFEGNGFLQYMVRIMTGTLIEAGLGERRPEQIAGILEAGDRKMAGFTAPPEGLCLMEVKYGEL